LFLASIETIDVTLLATTIINIITL
jgi:hypothetical protein